MPHNRLEGIRVLFHDVDPAVAADTVDPINPKLTLKSSSVAASGAINLDFAAAVSAGTGSGDYVLHVWASPNSNTIRETYTRKANGVIEHPPSGLRFVE